MFKDKFLTPLKRFLWQGTGPAQLALTVSAGLVIGIFPVWGTTTLICTLLALLFRWNMAAIQLANYFVYPIQLLMILPFIKMGQYIFGLDPLPYTVDEMKGMFLDSPLAALERLWLALLLGVGAWMVVAAPAFLLSYLVLRRMFRGFLGQKERER